nr:E59 [uncultured bacterium]
MAKGNPRRQNTSRAQDREVVQSALKRIRQAAVMQLRLGVRT